MLTLSVSVWVVMLMSMLLAIIGWLTRRLGALARQHQHVNLSKLTLQDQVDELSVANDDLQQQLTRLAQTGSQSERHQREYLQSLTQITLGIISRQDIDELLLAMVTRVCEVLGTPHGFLHLSSSYAADRFDPDDLTLECRVGLGMFEQFLGLQMDAPRGLASFVWREKRAKKVNHYEQWDGHSPDVDRGIVGAMVVAPLKSGADVAGVLGIAHPVVPRQGFEDVDVELLSRLAELASIALENARLLTRAQHTAEVLQYRADFEHHIAEISSQFVTRTLADSDAAITEALGRIGPFIGADRASVFLFEDEGLVANNTHEWCATGVESRLADWRGIAIDRDFPWFAKKLRGGDIVLVKHPDDFPPEAMPEKVRFQTQHVQSRIVVPIAYAGAFIGFLSFDALDRQPPWSTESVSLLRMVGEIIAKALSYKRMEQQNRKMVLEAARMQILTQFIAQASHEFRTPISAIKINTYMLAKTDAPEKRQQYIGNIDEQVNAIATLVEALTLMAQLDGSRSLTTHDVDLSMVLAGVLSSRQAILDAKHIEGVFKVETRPLMVRADLHYLRQAINAIVDNAVRFTLDGGTIMVRVDQCDDQVLIEITDTGVGISTADLPHIFERFYRSDKAGTTRGFGLGLPIAKAIVELHQGNIEVETSVGNGTTVRILLPAI